MQTEARVRMMMEGGGQRSFGAVQSSAGSTVKAAAGELSVNGPATRKYTAQCHSQLQQQQKQQPQVGTFPHLLAGGVAGVVSKTCTAPLGRLTILFQVQGMHSNYSILKKPSLLQEASRIVHEEGFRAFWKGNLVTIAHRLPYSSISYYAYDCYKDFLYLLPGVVRNDHTGSSDVFVRLLGGGLAGMTAASLTYPLDLVRTRLTVQTNHMYYQGIKHAFKAIVKDEGARGLYKGLGATLLGVGPNLAITFSVYESLMSNWRMRRPEDSQVMVSLASGSVSGIASSTVSFPLDLVRRRMQLEGIAGRASIYKSGVFATFKRIFNSEGFYGLYRGIIPEYSKVVPTIGISFMTYETLKSFLSGTL